jgi:hypothetical protein
MVMHLRFLGILAFLSLLFFTGCNKNEQISGKAFIERDVLVDVLVDIHLIDGVTNDRKFHRKYDADSIDLLSPILEKHHITRTMFDTTLATYSKHPDLFDQVYADVLIKLNVMLDKNDKEDGEDIELSRPKE